MRVIGLSGAQGAGKSTLLSEVRARGWSLDEFKVSRSVQRELGWESLDRVLDSFVTMVQFQHEVFRQKLKHDLELSRAKGARTIDQKGHVILTERTFADVWAYANLWAWRFLDQGRARFNEVHSFLLAFTRLCSEAQNAVYSGVLLLPLMDHIQWENDANRASRGDADSVYENIQWFMGRRALNIPTATISGISVPERADEVELFLRRF